jgi:RNA polymerase sigma factor (TIGR02999 family)
MSADVSLTEQLRRFTGGDREIAEKILREVLPRLHQIAVGHLARERAVVPLSPTELIHEVWLRSLHKGGWQIRDREHFYSIAAHAMRRVLVDFARSRLAQTRGAGDIPISLSGPISGVDPAVSGHAQIVEVGIMMERLEKNDPLAAQVVDLHYFAGFTLEESAEVMKLTLRQVRHRWSKAKRWLQEGLSD